LWFGLYSGFSGQPIFLTWAFQAYNIVFTAFPIIVFAVFDRDIDFDTLEKTPKIYRLTQRGDIFSVVVFWKWILSGLVQSLLVTFVPLSIYDSVAMDRLGQSYGLWEWGIVVYTITVIAVNLKLAMVIASWTWLHHLTMWGSIISYFIVMFILNTDPVFSNAGSDYTWVVWRLWSTPKYWLTVIVCTILTLYIDTTVFCLDRLNIAPKLLPASLEKWFIDTFPVFSPPSPEYEPTDLPQPKRHPIPEETPTQRRPTAGQEEKKDIVQRRSHGRSHTGFDFEYTEKEGERIERRSSIVKHGEAADAIRAIGMSSQTPRATEQEPDHLLPPA